jgi:hypothetical protein
MQRWIISVALVLCLSTRTARADLASSLYGDVRDVIEELIQTEVTVSVVRTVSTRSPALGYYMHGTLERLASPYWGSLGRVMKDDLTVAVADFVYWHLSTGGGDGDIVGSAKAFFTCAKVTAAASDGCKRLLAAINVQHRPLLEVECRRVKPTAERRVACHIGLAVLAALKGRGEVRHHLVDALADIVLLEIAGKDIGGRMRDVLTKWLDLPKDLPTPLLEALANEDLGKELTDTAIDTRCTDPKMIQTVLNDPTSPGAWICFAVTHPALPKALAATLKIKEGGKELQKTLDYWVLEPAFNGVDSDKADDDTIYRVMADLAFDAECPAGKDYPENTWPCTGKRLEAGTTISVSWQGRPALVATVGSGGKLTGAKNLMTPMLKFRKLMRRIRELQALVPPSLTATLFHAGQTVSPDAKSALRAAHRMARLVTELRARWYLWSQTSSTKALEELDIAELLHVARASLDETTIQGNAALAFLDKHAGTAGTLDIGDWLRMVMRQDYRSLAMESLRAALDLKPNQNRPHETFFLSLAAYLLDNSGADGVGENVARAAFRASAKELLLSASHKGVPRVGDRFRFRLLPRVALKLSFNDGYLPTDGDNRRTVVSADWPTLMIAFNDYLGLEASVLDPIAPLSEMALRPPGTYHDYRYVALDILRPRIGGWIAVPQFSRRLALTAGFGTRFLDVVRLDDGSDGTKLEARYRAKASLTFDAGLQFVF